MGAVHDCLAPLRCIYTLATMSFSSTPLFVRLFQDANRFRFLVPTDAFVHTS